MAPSGRGGVLNDELGFCYLYAAQTRDLVAVGTHADLVAAGRWGGRFPAGDPWGASWATYSRYSLDHRTGFTGVRILDPGTRVEISQWGVVFHHRPLPWLPSRHRAADWRSTSWSS